MKSKHFYSGGVAYILTAAAGFLSLLIISSCGTKKQLPAPEKEIVRPRSDRAADFLRHHMVYSYFSGKSKVEIRSPQISQSVTVRGKTVKDQRTHLSVSAGVLGVTMEAAQIYLSTDSIAVLDKYNLQYYLGDWGLSKTLLKMPLRLDMIQNLMVGNPLLISQEFESFNTESDNVIITQNIPPYHQVLTYNASSRKLEKVELLMKNSSYKLTASLSDYKTDKTSALSFPTVQHWHVSDGSESYTLIWTYEDFKFNESPDIKFSIPLRYKKVQLN